MNPIRIGRSIAKEILAEEFTEKVALYPGAFKPPHRGHVATVLSSLGDDVDKFIVFVSTLAREDVDVEESIKVWNLYKQMIPGMEVVEFVETPTPVKSVYDYVKDNPTHDIRTVFGKNEGGRFNRLQDPENYPNVEVYDAGTEGNYSSTELRQAIRDGDINKIQTYIPTEVNPDSFLNIFSIPESHHKGKKYLREAKYKRFLNEQWEDHKAHVINHFTDYATNYLSINRPKIKIITDPQYTQMHHSFGGYMPSTQDISVVVHNRNMADILRTLAHELVHHMQNLDDRLEDNSGEDGSPEENEANSLAAVIMRQYGRENSNIYE